MLQKRPKLPVQQLIVLSICRFAEPVVLTSVLPYLPEMVEHMGIPKNEIAKWVGITSAVSAISQCAMAVPWGTASDYIGRKPTILTGLMFTMIFSLVFGFSQNMATLLWARALLGLMNGNVGIIRTMVAEMVPEKELQPRAFSVMPLVWTIGTIFGPAFGGSLARPAEKHPSIFGGSEFWEKYPFLLPNLASACLFVVGIATGFLFLRETLQSRRDKRDYGLLVGQVLTRPCTSRRKTVNSEAGDDERTALLGEDGDNGQTDRQPKQKPAGRTSWREVFSTQSVLVLMAYGMLAMHNMAFDSLLPVFLHFPEQELDGNPDVQLPFKFIGGFGVDSQTIGLFYTLIGIFGMFVQFFFFPTIAKRYGVLNITKLVYLIFPIVYFVTPFTALVPSAFRNYVVFLLMLTKLSASIFSFPCCTILLTNSASSLNILGTLNGVGTSVSALGRAVGPAVAGATFSFGVKRGYVIIPWWTLTVMAALTAVPTFWIEETDGFRGHDADDNDEEDSESGEHDYTDRQHHSR
ncbi:MFS transporter [Aspergillus ruber CBS 135680]|uniref:MFS transporter n=1 Tax=Aspergillus ruber (strain CBS 135680) TaxID=1388766 RepID=A0A017SCN6_ASPRC|nr:MFS transporter [Aspergillus ruber CBS 135680]EYE94399.1 MFS transporter [Aspergillus ruber CBS 135680]